MPEPRPCLELKLANGRAYVTAEEMGVIDRSAMEEFGVDVLSLMENAGVAAAAVARVMLGGRVEGRRVAVLVGKGNNGGDGLVAARHLHNWGASVKVLFCARDAMGGVPAMQLRAIEKTSIGIGGPGEGPGAADIIVDALLGYNSKGDPREPIATMIVEANRSRVPILAVDIPSGLDATTGEPNEPCVVAEATVTMGFPKVGFLNPRAKAFVGELWLGDVSLPAEVYRRYSWAKPAFEREPVVKIA
jgi:hydroxyethylthiazole kinase-like uncharacterized protein yjeF